MVNACRSEGRFPQSGVAPVINIRVVAVVGLDVTVVEIALLVQEQDDPVGERGAVDVKPDQMQSAVLRDVNVRAIANEVVPRVDDVRWNA